MTFKQIKCANTLQNQMSQLPPSHSTHTHTKTSLTQQHPSHKQTPTTVCNLVSTMACPVARLFAPQCPHCERAAATACCWITVKYYPDDIDMVQFHSLYFFQVQLLPCLVSRGSCWLPVHHRPQDTTGVMSHSCR